MSTPLEGQDPYPLRVEIDKKIDELFEWNQKVVSALRGQATDWYTISIFFSQQSQRASEIATLTVEMAAIAAANTGDILVGQFGSAAIISDKVEETEEEDGGSTD